MNLSHLRGLDQDLARQTKESRKTGGPSNTLKRILKRPEGNYHSNAVRNNIQFIQCDECKAEAEFSSIINGEIEYQLCRACFSKRNK